MEIGIKFQVLSPQLRKNINNNLGEIIKILMIMIVEVKELH